MLTWLQRMFTSSIGKKTIMGLSGLALLGFLVVHVLGNLTLYADEDGAAFDEYARILNDNPLIVPAELGLLALFVVHIVLAVRLTLENREKRSQGYAVRSTKGRSTIASSSMMITGSVVLVFLLIHLYDFRFSKDGVEGLGLMVKDRLSQPTGAAIYVVGVGALTVHLGHAIVSATRSLGLKHAKYDTLIERAGLTLAVLIGLGFFSFPLVYLLGGA